MTQNCCKTEAESQMAARKLFHRAQGVLVNLPHFISHFVLFKVQFALEAREETAKEARTIAGKTKMALGPILSTNQKILFYMLRIFPCRFPAASLFIKNSNNFQSGPYSMSAVRTLKVK